MGCENIDPDPPDEDNPSPPSFPSEEGVRSVVELVPESEDVNLDLAGDGEQWADTPIFYYSLHSK